eukprot:7157792-Alexandrium_andersonii.AAC.1
MAPPGRDVDRCAPKHWGRFASRPCRRRAARPLLREGRPSSQRLLRAPALRCTSGAHREGARQASLPRRAAWPWTSALR